MLVKISDGTAVAIPYKDEQGNQYPPNMEQLWTDLELAAIGLERVPDPPPPPVGEKPIMAARALLVDISGGDIGIIDGCYNVAAAIYLDVGQFMVLFYDSLPTTNYYVIANGDASIIKPTNFTVDYFVVEVKNDAGNPIDPTRLVVQVYML